MPNFSLGCSCPLIALNNSTASYIIIVLQRQATSAEHESTREASSLAVWQLSDNQLQMTTDSHPQDAPPSYEETLRRDAASSEAVSPTVSTTHVMLSYNWGSQKTVLTISNILKKAGYNVWIDVDKMSKFVWGNVHIPMCCFFKRFLFRTVIYLTFLETKTCVSEKLPFGIIKKKKIIKKKNLGNR